MYLLPMNVTILYERRGGQAGVGGGGREREGGRGDVLSHESLLDLRSHPGVHLNGNALLDLFEDPDRQVTRTRSNLEYDVRRLEERLRVKSTKGGGGGQLVRLEKLEGRKV